MAEGDVGTWSHCHNPKPHPAHQHSFAMNEGRYDDIPCNGTPRPQAPTPQTDFKDRLNRIADEIELGMGCTLEFWQDHGDEIANGRFYFQIACERPDAITGVMGTGLSGKAYLSQFMSDSEIIQIAFGLYKGYWEHEARETFKWRERRVFGPHISTEALWEVARRVDVRKPKEN